jgi:hypothetical protein
MRSDATEPKRRRVFSFFLFLSSGFVNQSVFFIPARKIQVWSSNELESGSGLGLLYDFIHHTRPREKIFLPPPVRF